MGLEIYFSNTHGKNSSAPQKYTKEKRSPPKPPPPVSYYPKVITLLVSYLFFQKKIYILEEVCTDTFWVVTSRGRVCAAVF